MFTKFIGKKIHSVQFETAKAKKKAVVAFVEVLERQLQPSGAPNALPKASKAPGYSFPSLSLQYA